MGLSDPLHSNSEYITMESITMKLYNIKLRNSWPIKGTSLVPCKMGHYPPGHGIYS